MKNLMLKRLKKFMEIDLTESIHKFLKLAIYRWKKDLF